MRLNDTRLLVAQYPIREAVLSFSSEGGSEGGGLVVVPQVTLLLYAVVAGLLNRTPHPSTDLIQNLNKSNPNPLPKCFSSQPQRGTWVQGPPHGGSLNQFIYLVDFYSSSSMKVTYALWIDYQTTCAVIAEGSPLLAGVIVIVMPGAGLLLRDISNCNIQSRHAKPRFSFLACMHTYLPNCLPASGSWTD